MSGLDETKYQKYIQKARSVAGRFEEAEYQENLHDVVISLEEGGGGEDILASNVKTDDDSNVQAALDDLSAQTTANSSEIGNIGIRVDQLETTSTSTNARIDNLNESDIALLRGGSVRDLSKIVQRYSLLTVFVTGTGSVAIVDGAAATNVFDLGLTLAESPVIEGLGETYTGQELVEWFGIYTQDSIGSTTYTGSILDSTNKVFKMPDPELQTDGLWTSYLLDISFRVVGNFTGGTNSSNTLICNFSDGVAFSSNIGFLSPRNGVFQNFQQTFISRLNKDNSNLIQNGLAVALSSDGSDFSLTGIEMMIRISH